MLVYKSGFIKVGLGWIDKDIRALTISSLVSVSNVKIIVTEGSDLQEHSIRFRDNRNYFAGLSKTTTVEQWLSTASIADVVAGQDVRDLDTVDNVIYRNLFTIADKVDISNLNYGEGRDIPVGMEYDVIFSNDRRPEDELSHSNQVLNSLAVINGRATRMVQRDSGTGIPGAGISLDVNNDNQAGLLDFTDVGGFTGYTLDKTNTRQIARTINDQTRIITRLVFDSAVPFTGKTPILVIDGFMFFPWESFSQVDTNTLEIVIDHALSLERVKLRGGRVEEFVGSANPRDEGVNPITFDALNFIEHTDSFIILVNNDELCIHTESIARCERPGRYRHYRAPQGMIMLEDRSIANYNISDYNRHAVEISVPYNAKRQELADTTIYSMLRGYNQTPIDDAQTPGIDKYKSAFIVSLYSF